MLGGRDTENPGVLLASRVRQLVSCRIRERTCLKKIKWERDEEETLTLVSAQLIPDPHCSPVSGTTAAARVREDARAQAPGPSGFSRTWSDNPRMDPFLPVGDSDLGGSDGGVCRDDCSLHCTTACLPRRAVL